VREVMTAPVITVGPEQMGADVMLTMLDRDVHHLPVVSAEGEALGVISDIDLVAAEAGTPFLLRREIAEAHGTEELREVAGRLNAAVVSLHGAGVPAAQISEVVSVVADALIRRMIALALETRGPPPSEFVWMSLGSHGRREPMPSSDIDSGMAWRDQTAAGDGTGDDAAGYMHRIADDVAETIEVIGWRLDPHGVTASGSFSGNSIGEWRSAIDGWLSRPVDERVLIATSILLDSRMVYGRDAELDPSRLLHEAEDPLMPQRWMLRLALASKPPTGFRRNIVLEDSGEHRGTLDIKHGGLLPVVNLARYAGLRAGSEATSTVARLRAAGEAGAVAPEHARLLEEAHDLFAGLRLEHQVRQLEAGADPDDHLDPKDLNPLTRRYLRDAFREVAAVQKSLSGELTWGR
jgi:CBS domain-containing protein